MVLCLEGHDTLRRIWSELAVSPLGPDKNIVVQKSPLDFLHRRSFVTWSQTVFIVETCLQFGVTSKIRAVERLWTRGALNPCRLSRWLSPLGSIQSRFTFEESPYGPISESSLKNKK